jgi:putative spermidine/putrescine transport system permease protein
VSLFVSGGQKSTLTRNMFNALRDQIDPTTAAISTLVVILHRSCWRFLSFFGKNTAR